MVFPCGAESALEIHIALKDVMNMRLVGASGREDHGRMVYENYYGGFPNIADSNFIEELNKLIERESIDLILPTHDTILVFMAKNADKIKTRIAVPSLRVAEICRSKKKIYDLFKDRDFCPIVFKSIEDIEEYPVYIKLDEGQGSKGAFILKSRKPYDELLDPENYVITEFLPGEELTIDCFTDRHGVLQFVGPRVRKRVFDGVCVNSVTVDATDEIKKIGKIVSDRIGIRGSWYFQLKRDVSGKFKLLEASNKIAGNMNVFRGLGVNFPMLMVYDYLDFDVQVFSNDYVLEGERALLSRYNARFEYDTIYIDFDDTITKNEEVNANVMLFIYHQKRKGRILKLITKHKANILETLDKLAIHRSLFDEIIHLKIEDDKYKFIPEKERVIFVDNAYGERLAVKKHLNIPVFDVDALNTLIDWRE